MTVPKGLALSLNDMLGNGSGMPGTPPSEEELGAAPKKNFQPYHAQSVPKSENLEANAFSRATTGEPITTMMLRNIPNKYTQNTLLQEVDDLGFAQTYDFFYLPMDVHNRSNVGYAFINFLCPTDAERFRQTFSDHRFQRFQSRKISSVCTAHVQGLDQNLRHFENRAVTHARNDQYRPIVLRGNCRVDFEEAVAEVKQRFSSKTSASTSPGSSPTRSPTLSPSVSQASPILGNVTPPRKPSKGAAAEQHLFQLPLKQQHQQQPNTRNEEKLAAKGRQVQQHHDKVQQQAAPQQERRRGQHVKESDEQHILDESPFHRQALEAALREILNSPMQAAAAQLAASGLYGIPPMQQAFFPARARPRGTRQRRVTAAVASEQACRQPRPW